MAFLLVLAVALTGCGGSSSGELEAVNGGDGATGQEAATTTSAPTTTLAPTTTTTAAPVATQRSLLNAIPTATELPPGWADLGWDPSVELTPRTGDGFGFCGGPNGDQRAKDANVIAQAYQGGWQTNVSDQLGSLTVYAFSSTDDAAAFMASTERAISSCSSEELDVPEFVEGRDDDTGDLRVDIFAENGEPDRPWELFQTTSLGGAAAEGADEAFHYKLTERYDGYQGDAAYGVTFGRIGQYERHGTIVVIFALWGECCLFGFNNTDSRAESELPQYPALQAAADHLRPGFLAEAFNNTDT